MKLTLLLLILSAAFVVKARQNGHSKHQKRTEAQMPSASRGRLKKGKINGKEISYRQDGDRRIFQGDIILPDDIFDDSNNNTRRRLNPLDADLWPYGYIPYEINGADSDEAAEVISYIHARTVVRFAPRNGEANYVSFEDESGTCQSNVGYNNNGKQTCIWDHCDFLEMNGCCDYGSVIHEFAHTIGLWHTQSRDDRDTYVTMSGDWVGNVNWDIPSSYANDCGPYDYNSLMHYASGDFDVTITPKVGSGGDALGDYYNVGTAPCCNSDCDSGDGQLTRYDDSSCWCGGQKGTCVVLGQRDGLSSNDVDCINNGYLNLIRGKEGTTGTSAVGLGQDQSIKTTNSNNGDVIKLIMQSDMNLVLYKGSTPLWASGTNTGGSGYMVLGKGGDLRIWKDDTGWIYYSNTGYGKSLGPYTIGVSGNGFAYILNGNNEITWSVPNSYVSSTMPPPQTLQAPWPGWPETPLIPLKPVTPTIPETYYYNTFVVILLILFFVFVFYIWCVFTRCFQTKTGYHAVKFVEEEE